MYLLFPIKLKRLQNYLIKRSSPVPGEHLNFEMHLSNLLAQEIMERYESLISKP